MIIFRELRRRLSESVGEPEDIFELLEEWFYLFEDSTFYIYRTDTNAVLATGIKGFEATKRRASELRKSLELKFDDVKFRSERSRARRTIGVSNSGKSFTNNRGERYPVEYSRNYNPSKRSRFSGYYDKDGEFQDLS